MVVERTSFNLIGFLVNGIRLRALTVVSRHVCSGSAYKGESSQLWRPKLVKSKEYEVYEKIVFISLCLVAFVTLSHIDIVLWRGDQWNAREEGKPWVSREARLLSRVQIGESVKFKVMFRGFRHWSKVGNFAPGYPGELSKVSIRGNSTSLSVLF
jgi:hypothetical protein